MKVLWVSRHEMTPEQRSGLAGRLGLEVELEVVSVNITFPAHSDEAVPLLEAAVEQHECTVLAGVFPAHVAGALARRSGWQKIRAFVPVSVPAPAVEGQVRGGGFSHSHWEEL